MAEARKHALLALDLARTASDLMAEVRAQLALAFSVIHLGELEAGQALAAEAVRIAERLRQKSLLDMARITLGHSYQLSGNWQTARETWSEALAGDPRDDHLMMFLARLECEVGNLDDAAAWVQQAVETPGFRELAVRPSPGVGFAWTGPSWAVVARVTGDRKFVELFERRARTILPMSPWPVMAASLRIGLATIATLKGTVEEAAEHYDALLPFRSVSTPGLSPERALGLLARSISRVEEAVEHLAAATDSVRGTDYRPELAWCCYDYADVLLRRDAEGDREKARLLLHEGLEIATELGMRPLQREQPQPAIRGPTRSTHRPVSSGERRCCGSSRRGSPTARSPTSCSSVSKPWGTTQAASSRRSA